MPSNNVAVLVLVAVHVFVASLTSVVGGAPAAPSDAVDCVLRAAAAGFDALARSAEPVDLVPGRVTLVKDAAAVDDGGDTSSPRSAGAALVRSVAAFVGSRAVNVRAPVRLLLDSLERTLAQGNVRHSAFPVLETALRPRPSPNGRFRSETPLGAVNVSRIHGRGLLIIH